MIRLRPLLACVAALCGLASNGVAQPILKEIHGAPDAGIGAYVAALGDIDGDGAMDFALRDQSFGGSVDIISGKTFAVLHQLVGQGNGFGYPFCGGGDIDADGVPDIIVAAFGTGDGAVFLFSGSDFSLIRTHTGAPQAVLGYSVAIIGDVNGDAHADYAVTSAYNFTTQLGKVSVLSGLTGDLLYNIPSSTPGTAFGASLAAIGEVTGDGISDLALGEPAASSQGFSVNGAVRVYSGADGSHYKSIVGEADSAVMGWSIASLGDITGDGKAEIAVTVFSTSFHANGVAIYSAMDGAKLGEGYGDGLDGVSISPRVSALSDADGDGKTDVMFADRGQSQGRIIGLSSASMERLFIRESPLPGFFFPMAMADLGDVNGDGFVDFVVGDAAGTPPGMLNTGAAWVFTCRPLLATPPTLSAAAGGTVSLDIALGIAHAGAKYLVLGSLTPESGACGGFGIGPNQVHVPFCFDVLTDLSVEFANSAVFVDTYGSLDGYTAMAHAALNGTGVVLPPSAVGLQLWFFVLSKAPNGPWDRCWEPAVVEVVP